MEKFIETPNNLKIKKSELKEMSLNSMDLSCLENAINFLVINRGFNYKGRL